MGEISLANVARTLDAMLDGQMTAQARIAAHLVAAAEAAGHDSAHVIETLDAIAANTVLDEIWITDEQGFAYLTNVRDETGVLVPFQFNPDPAVQPQASQFYVLLASPFDSDDVITQPAQVREIDQEVYKYVGVSGVDQHRIVQVGNALAFDEQEVMSNTYTSPVMTAVMAAFGEPEMLSNAYTSQLDEIRTVFEGILGKQMIVQATLVDYFVAVTKEDGWSTEEINSRLRRIVNSTTIGEIHIVALSGDVVYTSLLSPLASNSPVGLLRADDLGSLVNGTKQAVDHPTAPRASDGTIYKYVTVAGANSPRFVQVGLPIEGSSPVFPRFSATPSAVRGHAGPVVRRRSKVPNQAEQLGGDVTELGIEAYPEFVLMPERDKEH